jgi:hypothetical protein
VRFASGQVWAPIAWGAGLLAVLLLVQASAALPPRDVDDLCAIFAAKQSWHGAAQSAEKRWDVGIPVMMAIIHQESRFRSQARPGYRRLLGIIPVGRRSSAYGYGQVKTSTWADYTASQKREAARRDRFEDVVDFVGWYGDVLHRAVGVPKSDPFHLYLAYHEGPGGFARRSFDTKPWLLGVAHKVQLRAERYGRQLQGCGGRAS